MSRTIRRKKMELARPFYVDKYFNVVKCWPWWKDEGYTEETHKRDQLFYHSDKWRANAPKRFRRVLNREFRAKNKSILKNAIRDLNDDITFVPFIKNSNWLYF